MCGVDGDGLRFPDTFGLAGKHSVSGADGILPLAQVFEVRAVGGDVLVKHPAGAAEHVLFCNDGGRNGGVAFDKTAGEKDEEERDADFFHVAVFGVLKFFSGKFF